MNKTTHTLLFALMLPTMAMLTACDRPATDGETMPPAATDTAPATDTMPPSEPLPPTETMPPEDMGTDTAGDEMAFADMDANQDGGISMDELTAEQMLHQHFAVADADGDGSLTEDEVAKHRADMGL